ncbi:MAG: hypothetical protein ACM34K_03285 [Bacillota bacterium]
MKLKELNELIRNENKCEEYLRSTGILKTFTNCISCGSTSLGMIRSDRYRCYSCKKEWSRRKGSILTVTRFNYSEFLICLKYFEVEFTAEMTSSEFGLNYKTVRMLYNLFRMKMGSIDEGTLEKFSKSVKGDTKTIGLNYKNGQVSFELEPKPTDDATVKSVRHRVQNSAAYYEVTLEKLKTDIMEGKGANYISPIERFWRFAAEKLFKYRGTEQAYFILYLKELEFRFNHRGEDLLDAIIAKLA